MKAKKVISLFLFGWIAPVIAMPLTENMVLTSADLNYPQIQAAISEVAKADANYFSAQGAFDPVLRSKVIGSPSGIYNNVFSKTELAVPINESGNNLFTGYRIGRGNFPVYLQDRQTFNLGEVNAGMEFPLLRDRAIDNRRAKIKQTKINTRLSEEDLKLKRLETRRNASIGYWIWYVEGKKLQIQKHILELALKRQSAIDKSIKAGDLPYIDSIDNQRIIAKRKAMLANQTATFKKAAYTLSLFYRNKGGSPIIPDINQLPRNLAVARDLPFMDQSNLEHDVSKHPAILRLKDQRSISMVDLDLARNKKLPVLNSRLYVAQDFGGGNPPLNRNSINYELVFEFPIFQREAKGEIRAAQAMLEKNQNEQRMQHDKLLADIRDALNQLKASMNVIQLSSKEVNLAWQVQRAENIRFTEGDSTLFLLNERELATAEAQLQYIEAVGSYGVYLADLKFATATV